MNPTHDGVLDLRPAAQPAIPVDGDIEFEPPSQDEVDMIRWHLAAVKAARNRSDAAKA